MPTTASVTPHEYWTGIGPASEADWVAVLPVVTERLGGMEHERWRWRQSYRTGKMLQPIGKMLQPIGKMLQPIGKMLQPIGKMLQPFSTPQR
ncbi:hypothetical protein [Neorhodopirellula lusitana]|uniref:hypothetical protein n=1 Tax=Neorhodopirellula lusitana TaxID=445327 RepID=UPI0024B79438|nr:hypothetical protein [Neorhodopirellula lusitana]